MTFHTATGDASSNSDQPAHTKTVSPTVCLSLSLRLSDSLFLVSVSLSWLLVPQDVNIEISARPTAAVQPGQAPPVPPRPSRKASCLALLGSFVYLTVVVVAVADGCCFVPADSREFTDKEKKMITAQVSGASK